MHLDADTVTRVLKYVETPVYLSADNLEWEKGPSSGRGDAHSQGYESQNT